MKADNPLGENLLVRLFSYSPREAGRDALEDFCTEALAWCLRESKDFRKRFIDLLGPRVRVDPTELPAINTQLAFQADGSTGEDEEDEDETARQNRSGRFDLVLTWTGKRYVEIYLENKVWDRFGKDQLPRYEAEIKRRTEGRNHLGATFLFTLTRSQNAHRSDRQILWADVFKALLPSGWHESRNLKNLNKRKIEAAFVCNQFADFLKWKGLAPVNIRKSTRAERAKWLDGLRFRQEVETLLKHVRKQHPDLETTLKNRVVFEDKDDHGVWLQMYNKGPVYFCVGVTMGGKEGGGYEMAVEWRCPGKFPVVKAQLPAKLKTCLYQWSEGGPELLESERTYWGLSRNVEPEFNGEGDKMREWLVEASLAALKIQKAAFRGK